jgi:hypothetical protein
MLWIFFTSPARSSQVKCCTSKILQQKFTRATRVQDQKIGKQKEKKRLWNNRSIMTTTYNCKATKIQNHEILHSRTRIHEWTRRVTMEWRNLKLDQWERHKTRGYLRWNSDSQNLKRLLRLPTIFIIHLAFPKAVDLSCKSNLYKPLRPLSPALPHSPQSTSLSSLPDPHKKKQKARETSVTAMWKHGAANYELQGSHEGSVITENMNRAEQSSCRAEANKSPRFGTLGFLQLQLHCSCTLPLRVPTPPQILVLSNVGFGIDSQNKTELSLRDEIKRNFSLKQTVR